MATKKSKQKSNKLEKINRKKRNCIDTVSDKLERLHKRNPGHS